MKAIITGSNFEVTRASTMIGVVCEIIFFCPFLPKNICEVRHHWKLDLREGLMARYLCSQKCLMGLKLVFCASYSTQNSSNHVFMDLPLCNYALGHAQPCGGRKWPFLNCNHKVVSIELSKRLLSDENLIQGDIRDLPNSWLIRELISVSGNFSWYSASLRWWIKPAQGEQKTTEEAQV